MSHLTQVCGLKRGCSGDIKSAIKVAPYTGVWIETYKLALKRPDLIVAPYTGVWIETLR